MTDRDPVARALNILRWMGASGSTSVGVRELAKELDMQPSTVSRLLARLCQEGVVLKDSNTRKFSLGPELYRLGVLASKQLNIPEIARPHLSDLVEACNETAFLGLYDPNRNEMLRVEAVMSSHPIQYLIVTNQWVDIYSGASGLAILAFLPEDTQASVLARAESEANAERPWLKRAVLEAELRSIRERGYACTVGRRTPGAVGIAAPVYRADGSVVGDVVLSLPEGRYDGSREEQLALHVKRSANAISTRLGATLPTSSEA